MAAITQELRYWLQDLRAYRRVSSRRRALHRPGQGVDHAAQGLAVQEIVARLHPERMKLRVIDIIQATPTTKTFRLARTDGPLPPFRPGQHVNVFVDVDGVLTSRPYSIASPANRSSIRWSVLESSCLPFAAPVNAAPAAPACSPAASSSPPTPACASPTASTAIYTPASAIPWRISPSGSETDLTPVVADSLAPVIARKPRADEATPTSSTVGVSTRGR